jgi:hypothetical protein
VRTGKENESISRYRFFFFVHSLYMVISLWLVHILVEWMIEACFVS